MLPRLLRSLLKSVFRLVYRVEVRGAEHVAAAGPRAVIVANHQSLLDGVLIAALLPGPFTFAVDSHVARHWWMRPLLRLVDHVPVDPTNPLAAKALIQAVRSGCRCVIFPEGRITVTGALMKVYEGPALIADKADAAVVPVRIEGAHLTLFSRVRSRFRPRWFPRITLTVLPARRLGVSAGAHGRVRRETMGCRLQDLMTEAAFQAFDTRRSLFRVLVDARDTHGSRKGILEDMDRRPLSYGRLIMASVALGHALARRTQPGETVGVLLPNAVGAVVTFFALQAFRRVPAMLNFTLGSEAMLAAVAAGGIRTVLTSRRFVAQAKLDAVATALGVKVTITFLEDVRPEIRPLDKLHGLCAAHLPWSCRGARAAPDDPAVVLFTSGSEGVPKGVVLSHANLLANIGQVSAVVDFNPADKVLNILPLFHCFGLTGGLLLPVLSGVPVVLYPNPLHYRVVPELVYAHNATVLFGTDTFLTGYARSAHAYDFHSLRYIFAGAERVRDETRRTYVEKFGLRILEGYGTTETAPVLAVNTPLHYRTGTVGRLLPAIAHRLESVAGVTEGGRLFVRGPNVMLGYRLAGRPDTLVAPPEGWHDTGDIVTIDADGFVRIQGRAARFAKIAGEMIPLAAVEGLAADLWPDDRHAAISLPDPRKGEQIILFTTRADADRSALLARLHSRGGSELMLPRIVRSVAALPMLGTGKTDYVAVRGMAMEGGTVPGAEGVTAEKAGSSSFQG